MYAVIVDGSKEFIEAAMNELKSKKFEINGRVAIGQNISGFDVLVDGLKKLEVYKKPAAKNSIYKTSSLNKVS
ncbi:MAG: hypothetical protein WCL34_13770 [Methylococcaceae bacterium]